ncbi:possible surface layer protein SlpB [Secundilactobacillus oryzae JCM 18671]|uniref:Possible surface layer protein SlpB n=1 Tax=Secundilactobacillus oryzae JCM 18671 TaxID=1291743 RepID=A0A081BHS9_9LACO|nr:hypothetical protein [Secundilactobacillus oryzae]GAK47597.1 possible surface layer protein SlpB [Secundilactobacillus oryzae JCM 18671]
MVFTATGSTAAAQGTQYNAYVTPNATKAVTAVDTQQKTANGGYTPLSFTSDSAAFTAWTTAKTALSTDTTVQGPEGKVFDKATLVTALTKAGYTTIVGTDKTYTLDTASLPDTPTYGAALTLVYTVK